MCMLALTTILVASEAMVTSKQPQWAWRLNLTSDVIKAASITLASMCILPVTAILATSEAMMASK